MLQTIIFTIIYITGFIVIEGLLIWFLFYIYDKIYFRIFSFGKLFTARRKMSEKDRNEYYRLLKKYVTKN